MNFFNEKRGLGKKAQVEHEFYYIIAQMFLIVLIAVALFTFIDDVADQTLFEKNYLSKDIALIVNSIYASPGDVSYTYPGDIKNFIIDFKPGQVYVYEEFEQYEELAYPKCFYSFLEGSNMVFEYAVVSADQSQLKLNKLGNIVGVENE